MVFACKHNQKLQRCLASPTIHHPLPVALELLRLLMPRQRLLALEVPPLRSGTSCAALESKLGNPIFATLYIASQGLKMK
jgi:hypothetical protein